MLKFTITDSFIRQAIRSALFRQGLEPEGSHPVHDDLEQHSFEVHRVQHPGTDPRGLDPGRSQTEIVAFDLPVVVSTLTPVDRKPSE